MMSFLVWGKMPRGTLPYAKDHFLSKEGVILPNLGRRKGGGGSKINILDISYKVLGKRSVQLEPF